MTPEQGARLGEIAVWVGTADELLRQAYAAVYAPGMATVTTTAARLAIAEAAYATGQAAQVVRPLLQQEEVSHE